MVCESMLARERYAQREQPACECFLDGCKISVDDQVPKHLAVTKCVKSPNGRSSPCLIIHHAKTLAIHNIST